MVAGGQEGRINFELHTFGNSLQKLNLTGTAASWMQRHFKLPEPPLTAGGALDKQHQELAIKREKKHI